MMDRDQVLKPFTTEQIMARPRMKLMYTTYVFQAGQPEAVRQQMAEALGLEAKAYDGIVASRNADPAKV